MENRDLTPRMLYFWSLQQLFSGPPAPDTVPGYRHEKPTLRYRVVARRRRGFRVRRTRAQELVDRAGRRGQQLAHRQLDVVAAHSDSKHLHGLHVDGQRADRDVCQGVVQRDLPERPEVQRYGAGRDDEPDDDHLERRRECDGTGPDLVRAEADGHRHDRRRLDQHPVLRGHLPGESQRDRNPEETLTPPPCYPSVLPSIYATIEGKRPRPGRRTNA